MGVVGQPAVAIGMMKIPIVSTTSGISLLLIKMRKEKKMMM